MVLSKTVACQAIPCKTTAWHRVPGLQLWSSLFSRLGSQNLGLYSLGNREWILFCVYRLGFDLLWIGFMVFDSHLTMLQIAQPRLDQCIVILRHEEVVVIARGTLGLVLRCVKHAVLVDSGAGLEQFATGSSRCF